MKIDTKNIIIFFRMGDFWGALCMTMYEVNCKILKSLKVIELAINYGVKATKVSNC